MTYTKEQIKTIVENAYSSKAFDKDYNFLGYVCGYPRRTITEEEKKKAEKQLEQIKKDKVKSYKKGEFWLCAMGCEKEGDFNNHRARAEFLTPDGKKWFVEFTTYQRKDMKHEELHLDYLINRTLQNEYEEKHYEIRKRNENNGSFYNRSKQDQEDYKKYEKQPYYWERYQEGVDFLKGKPSTRKTALQMINKLFRTNFKTLEIVDYLIEPDFLNIDK